MHIVLVGNTGSGKTALAKALTERLEIPTISSGAVARQLSDSDPSTRLALQQGGMAPEQAMRAAIRQQVEEADATRGGWILDGFPRTIEQLICLQQWSAAMPSYIEIRVDTWTCIERLVSRQREHDNPDAIARRLEFYEQETSRMLKVLRDGAVLTTIGTEPIDHMVEAVLKEIS